MIRSLSLFIVTMYVVSSGCTSARSQVKGKGDTRTKEVAFIDEYTFLLTDYSDDSIYAYQPSNPVKVGGVREGPLNEIRFLNALLGPNGEEVYYYRVGSCCPFKTPHGLIDNYGMLDRYQIYWDGSKDTLSIYLNMYDKGNLQIPVGLHARKH